MKKKSIIAAILVAVIAVIGVLVYREAFAKETPSYRCGIAGLATGEKSSGVESDPGAEVRVARLFNTSLPRS